MIYLDNAATTKLDKNVLEAMMPFLTEQYGNPGSMHGLGRYAAEAIAKARKQVADLIKAEPEQIIFTSSGSEANNMVFHGIKPYLVKNNKNHIVASAIEHPSVLRALDAACRPPEEKMCIKCEFDTQLSYYLAPANKDGTITIGAIQEGIQYRTGLVSVMHTNNETGVSNPIKEIGELCSERNILLHTDCVQAICNNIIDVRTLNCDFLSLSSHKIHGPKGAGALYVKSPKNLSPLINGGVSQEFGLRGGTENVAAIVGFGQACDELRMYFSARKSIIACRRKFFISRLLEKANEEGLSDLISFNGNSSGSILSIRFDGVDGQTLLLMLNSLGVAVSTGSACNNKRTEPSHVLTAMNLSPSEAASTIRVSFSYDLTADEVVEAADKIISCVKQIKEYAR